MRRNLDPSSFACRLAFGSAERQESSVRAQDSGFLTSCRWPSPNLDKTLNGRRAKLMENHTADCTPRMVSSVSVALRAALEVKYSGRYSVCLVVLNSGSSPLEVVALEGMQLKRRMTNHRMKRGDVDAATGGGRNSASRLFKRWPSEAGTRGSFVAIQWQEISMLWFPHTLFLSKKSTKGLQDIFPECIADRVKFTQIVRDP